MAERLPRLLIAAPASGGGKTTLTLGLLRALLDRGLRPAAFKCGPDYIDPMFHREALGVPGGNLDLFLTPPDTVRGLLARGAAGRDIAVLEGVMGYYDGVGAGARAGSWHLAVETRTPAVLALRPKGAFLSLAALVAGFAGFRQPGMLRGVVLNRCAAAYADKLAPMLERETGLRVYGHVPDLPEAALASRHLGLATPDAVDGLRHKIRLLADAMRESLDLDALLDLAAEAPPLAAALPSFAPVAGAPVRIAVANDAAFCFYYRENLDLLREFGAEPHFFSPLRDAALPEGCHGLYLGGGYPELHAAGLAGNRELRAALAGALRNGMPVIAECGGFLYLQEELRDPEGTAWPMVGFLPGRSADAGRLRRFGYLEMTARRDTLLCEAGGVLPAHEFHYWDSDQPGADYAAAKPGGAVEPWSCAHADARMYAGFPHLYFWSDPAMAERFVAACVRYAQGGPA